MFDYEQIGHWFAAENIHWLHFDSVDLEAGNCGLPTHSSYNELLLISLIAVHCFVLIRLSINIHVCMTQLHLVTSQCPVLSSIYL